MGCDTPYLPTAPSPWDRQGIGYDEWFELFPVELRPYIHDSALTCGQCGALVPELGARLHKEWHDG